MQLNTKIIYLLNLFHRITNNVYVLQRCFYNGTFASCVIPTQDKLVAQLSPTRTKRQAGRDTSGWIMQDFSIVLRVCILQYIVLSFCLRR